MARLSISHPHSCSRPTGGREADAPSSRSTSRTHVLSRAQAKLEGGSSNLRTLFRQSGVSGLRAQEPGAVRDLGWHERTGSTGPGSPACSKRAARLGKQSPPESTRVHSSYGVRPAKTQESTGQRIAPGHLAKVRGASSNLVARSEILQNPLVRGRYEPKDRPLLNRSTRNANESPVAPRWTAGRQF